MVSSRVGCTHREGVSHGLVRVDRSTRVWPCVLRQDLEDALLASKLCSYAQGMHHLRNVSEVKGWGLKASDLATIW